ncbi:hypothetical protein ES703_81751 [subsurface metagenome]
MEVLNYRVPNNLARTLWIVYTILHNVDISIAIDVNCMLVIRFSIHINVCHVNYRSIVFVNPEIIEQF